MADHTKIEWSDATWNVITGCSVVSAGCRHCYAMKLAGTRLQHHPSRAGLTIDTKEGPVWNGEVRFNEQWMDQPLRWRRPRKVFVCAHGDLFHESVPDAWIDRVFAVMALAPRHTFQVLTKRANRMRDYLSTKHRAEAIGFAEDEPYEKVGRLPAGAYLGPTHRRLPLPNVWLGVSVEDQAAADERIPALLQTPAAVRWISAEPLLGPLDLTPHLWGRAEPCAGCPKDADCDCGFMARNEMPDEPALHWVVVGGESGTNARPMHPEWAANLRNQCGQAGVPFLFKQWGEWVPGQQLTHSQQVEHAATRDDCYLRLNGTTHWIDEDDHGPFEASDVLMMRVGKKAAGRLLDGKLHDGYPEARP